LGIAGSIVDYGFLESYVGMRVETVDMSEIKGMCSPIIFATKNDSLNGAAMLFGHLLTITAQVFADVRTFNEARPRENGSLIRSPRASRECHDPFDQL
jgi:L-fucose isomerase-like protein